MAKETVNTIRVDDERDSNSTGFLPLSSQRSFTMITIGTAFSYLKVYFSCSISKKIIGIVHLGQRLKPGR